jgi:hypothetical protein
MPNNEPYIVPFYHDFYPTWADPKTPSSLQRSESWKDNSHYQGDNVRDLIYPDAFPRSTTNKVLNGVLKFDDNNEVWEHEDKEIDYEIKKHLTSKYGMENYDILITIDRVKHEIRYEAVIDDAKKISSKTFGKVVEWQVIPNKTRFVNKGENLSLELNLVNKRLQESGFKNKVYSDDIWIKDSEQSAHLSHDENIKLTWGRGETNPFTSPVITLREIERIERKNKKDNESSEQTFTNLEDGKKFVFKDALPILRQYHIAWDEVFTKRNNKAVRKNGTEINLKDQNIKIITEEDFNKEVKYKKDRLENFFDGLFSEYETKQTNIGEEIRIPIENFWKSMEEDEVFKNKFISLSAGPKDSMHGHYNGKYNNFVWTINKDYADFVKMEH